MIVSIDVYTWQLLRMLVREENKIGEAKVATLMGWQLRHTPTRYTKNGKFLDKLVNLGLLIRGKEVLPERKRGVAQFYFQYSLTDKGRKAAEYGEYEKADPNPIPVRESKKK